MKKVNKKKKRKLNWYTIVMIIIDIFVAGCFFLFYGPYTDFKNMIISTAMVTKTHQYIAYTFYSEEEVSKVVALNSYIVPSEEINLDDIIIDTSDKKIYKDEYDKAILVRNEGNEDYKLINIKISKYDAYLVAIYDPSKVTAITSKSFNTGNGQESVLKMCKRYNGLVCINGGGFVDYGMGSDIPIGYIIKDGEVIWSDSEKRGNIIGITYENKLSLINATGEEAVASGIRDGLEFGPFLIVNGQKITNSSGAGGYDRAARVAIAQRKDGIILFLVTDGVHSRGPTLIEIADTLEKYGAYNAANLDGGTSSQLVINNKLINNPLNVFGERVIGGRSVVSGFGLLP